MKTFGLTDLMLFVGAGFCGLATIVSRLTRSAPMSRGRGSQLNDRNFVHINLIWTKF